MPDNYDILDGKEKADLIRKLRKPVRKYTKPTIHATRIRSVIRPEYDRDYISDTSDEMLEP